MAFALPLDTQPMEAKAVAGLPDGPGWQFEPKWDGFRCLAFKGGGAVDLRAKSGKSLARYFPEMVEALARARPDGFVLDGELAVPRGDTLSFGALQDRVHPAESRIRKLSAATPALLIVFDCLATEQAGRLLDATPAAAPGGAGRCGGRLRACGPGPPLPRSPATGRRLDAGWSRAAARWTASSPSAWTRRMRPASARCRR